jgi:hypothetical protein
MHRSEFLKELKETFPELRDAINQHNGLLAFEIGEFTSFTNQAIGDQEKSTVETCYRLAQKAYLNGNKTMKALINTEYVESLNMRHNEWAWEMLPDLLKELYIDFFGLTPKEQFKLKKTFR